jgi:hypothetical protein
MVTFLTFLASSPSWWDGAVHAVLLVLPYLGLLLVPLVDRIAVLMKGKE